MVLKIPIRRKSRCWSLYGWMKLRLLGESSRSSPAEEKVKINSVRRCSELFENWNSRSSPLWRWALFLIDDIMERKDGIAGVQIGISRGKVYFRTTDDTRRAIKI